MTQTDFFNEVVRSSSCPSDFSFLYKEFIKYQNQAWDTLVEFARLCDSNQIPYQLAYGSLLGAVRDGGQIPWDYDVDVFVPFEYRDKLITSLNVSLSKDYYYYSPEVDHSCRHYIVRVSPKGYDSDSLHVDVFFLTGVSDNVEERIQEIKRIKHLSLQRHYKLLHAFSLIKRSPKNTAAILLGKMRSFFVNITQNTQDYFELCNRHPAISSEYCVSADQFSDWYLFPKTIWNTDVVTVKGIPLRVPKDYDSMLKLVYGDYNNIPPVESRIKELVFHYKKIHDSIK